MHLSLGLLKYFIVFGIVAPILCISPNASAAEQVIMKYKVFRESVSIPELTAFVETGEASSELQSYLRTSRQRPEDVRRTLGREIDVNVVTLDRVLNSPVGHLMLDQISLALHPPQNTASRQAMRAALVLSASRDHKISLIEVLQNYPTSEIELEGDRIAQVYRQIRAIGGRIRNVSEDSVHPQLSKP